MKYSKTISCLAASLLLLAAGCDKEQNGTIYSPGSEDAKEIHFIQSSLTKEFPQGTETGTRANCPWVSRRKARTRTLSPFRRPSPSLTEAIP